MNIITTFLGVASGILLAGILILITKKKLGKYVATFTLLHFRESFLFLFILLHKQCLNELYPRQRMLPLSNYFFRNIAHNKIYNAMTYAGFARFNDLLGF